MGTGSQLDRELHEGAGFANKADPGSCAACQTEPAKIAKWQLCLRCYGRLWGRARTSHSTIAEELERDRQKQYVPGRRRQGSHNPDRDERIAELRRAGRTYQEIGDEAGLTRERVRQILQRFELAGRLGSEPLRKCNRKAADSELGKRD